MDDEPRAPSPAEDLMAACEKTAAFTHGYAEDEFCQDALVWSAVAYQIIVLGEAAKRLAPEIRERYAHNPWKEIIGMRDILSHKYDTINLGELWQTVRGEVPTLLDGLRAIQSALRP